MVRAESLPQRGCRSGCSEDRRALTRRQWARRKRALGAVRSLRDGPPPRSRLPRHRLDRDRGGERPASRGRGRVGVRRVPDRGACPVVARTSVGRCLGGRPISTDATPGGRGDRGRSRAVRADRRAVRRGRWPAGGATATGRSTSSRRRAGTGRSTINLRTQALTCRAVVRQMLAQEPNGSGTRGSILLMGSVTASDPAPEFFATHAYAAAKGATIGLMTTMAAAYATHGIRVNVVAPSLTDDPDGQPCRRRPGDPGLCRAPAAARRRDDGPGRGRARRRLLPVRRVARRHGTAAQDRRRLVRAVGLARDGARDPGGRAARDPARWPTSTSASSAAAPPGRPPRSPPLEAARRCCWSTGSRSSAARAPPSSTRSMASTRPGRPPARSSAGSPTTSSPRLRSLGPVMERPNTYGAGTGVTYLAEHLKVVWEALVTGCRRPGPAPRAAAGRRRRGRPGRRRSSWRRGPGSVASRRGSSSMPAATPTCRAFAGFGYETAGELDPAQTLTTTFRMANVDLDRRRAISKQAFHELMAEAAESGDYDLPRREGSDHITPIEGVTATIMTRLDSYRRDADGRIVNATDPWFLTEAEMAGRRQALEYVRFLPRPGARLRAGIARRARDPDRRPRDAAGLRRLRD